MDQVYILIFSSLTIFFSFTYTVNAEKKVDSFFLCVTLCAECFFLILHEQFERGCYGSS